CWRPRPRSRFWPPGAARRRGCPAGAPTRSCCGSASWPTSPMSRRWSAWRRGGSPSGWARTSPLRPRASPPAPTTPPPPSPATALLAGQLDGAYVGPTPAINAWQKSGGTAIKIVSGAASGGASLVVRGGIASAAQLKGKSLATPSLGNTQDVAARYWLKQHGLTTTPTGGGDVAIKPIKPNSAAVLQFKSGQLDGGWEPEPYATEMVLDGGKRLVNEASLWPGGKFVTTDLVVTQSVLKDHPSPVNRPPKGQVQANRHT